MRRVSSAAVVDDDRSNDDAIHVSSLLEAGPSGEDRESSESEHLSDHFFLELVSILLVFDTYSRMIEINVLFSMIT